MMTFQNIIIITGHYGCGKTNLSINLALYLAKQDKRVTVVDLDIVNPYFRTYDYKDLFAQNGIEILAPNFASTNLDVPSLPGSIRGRLQQVSDGIIILDVGGDDAGAIALGQYSALIREKGYEMLYVFNPYRLLTATPENTLTSLREIEAASRLNATSLVNNANLGPLTTREVIAQSVPFAGSLSSLTGLPIRFTVCTPENSMDSLGTEVFPAEIFVKSYDI